MTLTLFGVCSGDISEKEYHGDSEDSGVWAARRQRSSRCKPIPSRRRLRRVGRSEGLYLYLRDEHQWTILQSVVGRVKTGMMVSWIVNTGYWLYQWCIIFLYIMHILGSAGWQGCSLPTLKTAVEISVRWARNYEDPLFDQKQLFWHQLLVLIDITL